MDDDRQLLTAWREGDEAAGSALVSRYFDALYAFFAGKVPEQPDELLQRTLLACVEHRDRFEGRSSFRTYLFSIARNELYMYWRKRGRTPTAFDPQTQSIADLGTSPSSLLARRREQRLLLEGLRSLPLSQQLLLELYYWENLSGPELAEVFEAAQGTIRSRIKAAQDALHAAMSRIALSREVLASTQQGLQTWARQLRAALGPPRE